jgi:hypothetical protein
MSPDPGARSQPVANEEPPVGARRSAVRALPNSLELVNTEGLATAEGSEPAPKLWPKTMAAIQRHLSGVSDRIVLYRGALDHPRLVPTRIPLNPRDPELAPSNVDDHVPKRHGYN